MIETTDCGIMTQPTALAGLKIFLYIRGQVGYCTHRIHRVGAGNRFLKVLGREALQHAPLQD